MSTSLQGGAPTQAPGEGPTQWATPAGGGQVLEGPAEVGEVGIAVPGLILIDESWSMERDLAAASAALDRFVRKLRQHGAASPNAWLSIVSFADTAITELETTRLADPAVQLPVLAPRGTGTNFCAAFTETLSRFRADLPRLQQFDGGKRQVFRPSVYMITDGEHNTGPDWRAPLAELKSRSWRPNVFAFGYRDASRDTIREIASEGLAYFAEDGQDPDTMFEKILEVILRSVISATVTGTQIAANPSVATAVPVIDPSADKATAGLALIDPISGTID